MQTPVINTDYLIVGSGAVGMAFADVLLKETSATLTFVDRHHGPGGHWNDAYPFVRLHQPSAYYGINSRPLGQGSKDATGVNQGMYERATGAELVSYYEQAMQGFLATGRVQYLPMCNYTGDYASTHTFTSLVSGEQRSVNVAKKVVDTTFLQTAVPSTHPPKYAVAPGLVCIPLNDLPRVKQAHSGYVVVGSGKTGIDACLWLLDNGVPAERITWIMPRDAWYMNRAKVQPGEDFFMQSYGSFADQLEAIIQAQSINDVFDRLSACGVMMRLDETVQPTMFHGAIMSESELLLLRSIKNVVRLGRVQRIDSHQIVLDQGSISTDPDRLYIDCSSCAALKRPSVPVFAGNKITPQFVRTFQPTFSAAFIAHAEATLDDEAQKNLLCTVVPISDQCQDWLSMMAINMGNQHRWSKDKDLQRWIVQSRLDGFSALARNTQATDTDKLALLQRYGKAAGPAAAKLAQLLAL